MAKLENIKAIKQMLAGEHRMQTRTTVGWRSKKDSKKVRKIGEIWEEKSPDGSIVVWEQCNGYRRRRKKNLNALYDLQEELREFPNCYDDCEKRKTKVYTRHDYNTRKVHGMCLDCLAKKETELKVQGKWDAYVKEQEYKSTLSWIADMEREVQIMKDSINGIGYVEQNGEIEKWVFQNKDQVLADLDRDFEEFKAKVLKPFQDG